VSAQIHDLGYREYDGPRAGVGHAMVSLGLHAVQRVLGLKRAARHKVLPAIVILVAFIPAMVFVGLAAPLVRSRRDRLVAIVAVAAALAAVAALPAAWQITGAAAAAAAIGATRHE